MAELQASGLTLAYDKVTIVDELSLDIPSGEVTMVVGANGCGKSTLLRALARLLKPAQGQVLLDGADIHTRPAKDVAKQLGLLPQTPSAPDGITVRELVSRGRYPHQGWFQRFSPQDEAAVARAMEMTRTSELANRAVDELSGGQRQRVWIAMALAQETGLLLLDEPTTYLDIAHQLEVLDVIAELNRTRGITVVIVLHDLNLAARYADHLVALKDGKIHVAGHPTQVVTEEMVKAVFGMPSRVIPDPVAGTPLVLPIGKHRVLRAENLLASKGIFRSKDVVPQPETEPSIEHTAQLAPSDEAQPNIGHCPTLAFETQVVRAENISQSFRRITLSGSDLEFFGTNSEPLDLRVKLLLSAARDGVLPTGLESMRPGGMSSPAQNEGWYRRWLQIDPEERGVMRTYTVRAFRPTGHRDNNTVDAPEMDIDFVLHGVYQEGHLKGGPATEWGAGAKLGDRLLLLGPNKMLNDESYGGIEFRRGQATRLLLAGDETAAPAICSILESLPSTVTGDAFIEVPEVGDILGTNTRSGVSVQWLTRGTQPHGQLLSAAVREAVAIPAAGAVHTNAEPEEINIDETILWETGSGSASPFYAWIAGEAGTVKLLRRYLVREAGIDRKQVAFMGYWRHGKSEN